MDPSCAQEIAHCEQPSKDDEEHQQHDQTLDNMEDVEGPELVDAIERKIEYEDRDQMSSEFARFSRLNRPLSYYEVLPGVLGDNHPGICVEESRSTRPRETSTSPECCLWVQSEEVVREILSMVSQVCYREATKHDMPRIVSCLQRVYRHVYRVRTDLGLAYPPGATGALAVTRNERERIPPPPGLHWLRPPPSKLREVWNIDDFEAEEDDEEVVNRLEVAALRMFSLDSDHNGTANGANERLEAMEGVETTEGVENMEGIEAMEDDETMCEDGQQPANDGDEDMDSGEAAHIRALLGEMDSDDEDDNEDDDDPLRHANGNAPI